MKKDIFCIIAVGYNRPYAMKRLLISLAKANYLDDQVDLLISIDRGQLQSEIVEIAGKFRWKHGDKIVRAYEERQGLKKHILQCGDYSKQYKAIIVLEDDITVSKAFYWYAKNGVEKYKNDNRIAGISLYRHKFNVEVGHFFDPDYDGNDCFMMQFAQSWGQCWTSEMWQGFRKWYIENDDYFTNYNLSNCMKEIPGYILKWGGQSWLKFFMAYIIEKELYFIYPHFSLTTNHSEVGQHCSMVNGDYQVELNNYLIDYRFPNFENAIKYDAFFERIDIKLDKYVNRKIIMDLYGNKRKIDNDSILISTRVLNYKILEQLKMKYKPQEVNCIYCEKGSDIFIYDTNYYENNSKLKSHFSRTRYDVKAISWKKLLKLGLLELRDLVHMHFSKL